MMQAEFLAALAIGFFGSLHCIGMCGPIALVTPTIFPGKSGRILSGLVYNSGRIFTYMILGIILGLFGKGLLVFEVQQWISIVIGVIIVLSIAVPGIFSKISGRGFALSFTNKIKTYLSSFLKKKSIGGLVGIGLVNGLLPCGLVYIALAGSLDQSSARGGMFFMLFFGLGTLPMMTGAQLMGNNLKGSFKNRLSRILPSFIFLMGLLFILRGLGLGIPYVSPSMDPHTGDIECTSPAHRHMK